jgi:hypothetical protein
MNDIEQQNYYQESLRKVIDMAIAAGRSRQSSHTNFIHYAQHSKEEEQRDVIPIVENFLFALALLRSRTSDSVIEAKKLLERLFHFQVHNTELKENNFPIFLHEYPKCYDSYLGVQLLPIFFWIIKDFHHVLGSELRHKTEESAVALLIHASMIYQEKGAPYTIALKLAASLKAWGDLLKLPNLSSEGENFLIQITQSTLSPHFTAWYCPHILANTLVSLQMIYPNIAESPWKHFWNWINQTWHRKSCCYVGPILNEKQKEKEPQPTLYDLFLGYLSGTFSLRTLTVHPFHLQGALIQPTSERLVPLDTPLTLEGQIGEIKWLMRHEENYAFTLFQQANIENSHVIPKDDITDKSYYPLRIIWGDNTRAHSLVCQQGQVKHSEFQVNNSEISLKFTSDHSTLSDDREKNREVSFYIDEQEDINFFIAGHRATTFKIGDEIQIDTSSCIFSLQLSCETPEDNTYLGHLMRGNRPSQISLKDHQRFQAFDWQIFLRAVRRKSPSIITAKIKISEKGLHT